MYDEVEASLSDSNEITLEVEGISHNQISFEPEKNSAGLAALALLKKVRIKNLGIHIRVKKGIPPGSGLGSSGASAAATVVALNSLLNLNYNKETLVEIASLGEIASAGAPHADNVAPAILGGFTVIYSYNPIRLLTFPPPKKMIFSIAVPQTIQKTTKKARSVVPSCVPIKDFIFNLGGASMVLSGLLLSNPELVGKGMLRDAIIEPVREKLYPGYVKAKQAALESGAYGVTLSGAGPSAIAISPAKIDHQIVANAMVEAFEKEGVSCRGYVTRPTLGAYVEIKRNRLRTSHLQER